MATYLKGVTDAVQQVRPPKSNLQFDAQLLSTRQSAYDKNHNKLSKMYGSILNSSLTREDNIKSRDEFFKLIDQDIKKLTGEDLSKRRNVEKGQQVFRQIYDNDYLAKDMVWTKNYQAEMQRAENFKNCADDDECGGQYWDEGVKYMQYKREEFRNATSDESLRHSNVDFIPKQDVMGKAIEQFKKLDPKVKRVVPSEHGKYRITYTNGDAALLPVTDLLGQTIGRDSDVMKMYEVMAHNTRKDEIYQSMAAGEYENLNDASVGWFQRRKDQVENEFKAFRKDVNLENVKLTELLEAYQEDYKNGKLKESDLHRIEQIEQALTKSQQLKGWTDTLNTASKNLNSQSNRKLLENSIDQRTAMVSLNNDMVGAAKTIVDLTAQEEWEVDQYSMEDYKHKHRLELEYRKHQNAMSLAKRNAELENNNDPFKADLYSSLSSLDITAKEINDMTSGKQYGLKLFENIPENFRAQIDPDRNGIFTKESLEKSRVPSKFIEEAVEKVNQRITEAKMKYNEKFIDAIEEIDEHGQPSDDFTLKNSQGDLIYTDWLDDNSLDQYANWAKQLKQKKLNNIPFTASDKIISAAIVQIAESNKGSWLESKYKN